MPTPAVSICVLTYGDYPDLARTTLDSIIQHCARADYQLIVGGNAVSPATADYLQALHAEGAIDQLLLSPENLNKCPMMRRMFAEVEAPLIWWFDDDSFVQDPDALPARLRRAAEAPAHEQLWGHMYFFGHENDFNYGHDVRAWVRSAPWYRGLEPPGWEPGGKGEHDFEGRGCGDGRWFFITGGNWLVRTEAIQALDWPDTRLIKRNDDVFLTEAIRQQGWSAHDIGPLGVAINTQPRRGAGEDAQTMQVQMETAPDTPVAPAPPLPPHLDLDGWFLSEEAVAYRRIASRIHDGTFVELGVWKGKSMSGILDIAARNRCHIFAVDLWYDYDGNSLTQRRAGQGRQIFEQNIALLGHSDRVTVIEEDSAEAARHFQDGSVDCIFVDGDHSHAGVVRDLRAWLPKLKPGGVLFGHDYIWHEGVRTGLAEVLGDQFKQLEGSLWQALTPWDDRPAQGRGCIFIPTFEDADLLTLNFADRPDLAEAIDIHIFDDNFDPSEIDRVKHLCEANGWHYHFIGRDRHNDWQGDQHDLSGFNKMIWDIFIALGQEYDYVIKVDSDAWIVQPDFYLEFDRLLHGRRAIAGTVETRHTGHLQHFWDLGAHYGYTHEPGEWSSHIQGGIYGLSKAAISELAEMGFMEGVHAYFAEDAYMSLSCTLLGIPLWETDHTGSWWHPYLPEMARLRYLRAVHPMTKTQWESWQV
jgi:GT2 family glycosyltransferase